MDKYTILKECLYIYKPNIDDIFNRYAKNCKKPQLTTEAFLQIISRTKYSISRDFIISASTISKLLKEIFPDRETSTTGDKPCNYLLGLFQYKWCGHCKEVLEFENFRKNASLKYGLNTFCKSCQVLTTSSTQPGRQSEYRSSKLTRTPLWANLNKIKEIYNNCPVGMHVDHIVPLQGEKVSGLHVENNLQYLTPTQNCSKYNIYSVE